MGVENVFCPTRCGRQIRPDRDKAAGLMASGLASKGSALLSIRRLAIAGVEARTEDLVYLEQFKQNERSMRALLTLQ